MCLLDLSRRFSASNKLKPRPRSILKAHCRRPVVPYQPPQPHPQPQSQSQHQPQRDEVVMSRSSSLASTEPPPRQPAAKQAPLSSKQAMVNVKASPYSNGSTARAHRLSNSKNLSISSEAGTTRQRHTRQRPASAKRKKKVTSSVGGITKEVRHLRSLPQRLSKKLLHAQGGGVGGGTPSCTSSTSSLVSFDIGKLLQVLVSLHNNCYCDHQNVVVCDERMSAAERLCDYRWR